MRTDERDAQPNQGSKGLGIETYVAIVIAVLLLLFFLFPSIDEPSRESATVPKCKNILKQIGLCIQSYYSDGTSINLPVLKRYEVSPANDGGLGFDANMMSCPAARLDNSSHYVWNPKLSGGKWPEWSTPKAVWIWDAAQHRRDNKLNVLFGDGHVEEMTPERLKELTR